MVVNPLKSVKYIVKLYRIQRFLWKVVVCYLMAISSILSLAYFCEQLAIYLDTHWAIFLDTQCLWYFWFMAMISHAIGFVNRLSGTEEKFEVNIWIPNGLLLIIISFSFCYIMTEYLQILSSWFPHDTWDMEKSLNFIYGLPGLEKSLNFRIGSEKAKESALES